MGRRRRIIGLGTLALVAALLPLTSGASGASGDGSLVIHGVLQTVVVDDFDDHRSRRETTLLLRDGTRLDVRRTAGLPETGRVTATVDVAATDGRLTTRSREGLRLARTLAGPVTLHDIRPDGTRGAQTATGSAHHAYVAVLRSFGDFGGVTDEQLRGRVQAAADYWATEAGAAVPSFTIADLKPFDSSVGCGLEPDADFWSATTEAATELYPGVDFYADPNHLVVLVPDECAGGPAGKGSLGTGLGSGGVSVNIAETATGVKTIAHELGHNFSLDHANAESCYPPPSTLCYRDEYADLYDVMGFGSGHPPPALNSGHRQALGLLTAAEAPEVRLPDTLSSTSRTVTVGPRGSTSGQRSLRLVDPETGEETFVDHRTGTGRDTGAFYMSGVRLFGELSFGAGVTIATLAPSRSTTLRTRHAAPQDFRAAWQPGETFTNDRGTVSVRVDAIDPGGSATVTATLATDWVPFPDPVTPVIQGTPHVDELLTFEASGWPADVTLEPRWLIDGEPDYGWSEAAELYLFEEYRGAMIQLEVTARREGNRPMTVRSAPVGPVIRPVEGWVDILGRARVGEQLRGDVETYPSADQVRYQWRTGGSDIPGATARTYSPTPDDVGKSLRLRAIVSAVGFDETVLDSPAVTVGAGTLTAPTPKVAGRPKVGKRLTAKPGEWTAGTAFSYRWLANGRSIRRATGPTLRLKAVHKGKRISVRVTGSQPGYTSTTRTSARTGKVRR